jgi:Flp pilus assembly protein TadG
MPHLRALQTPRRGVAAVEFAFLAPVLLGLLLGVWEIGRLIQVQQMVSTSAREGARLAAQGQTVQGDSIQYVYASPTTAPSSSSPNVQTQVLNFLQEAGIPTTNATVTFQYLNGNTSLTDPYQGAQGQMFSVTVTVPYNNFRWTTLDLTGAVNLTCTVVWTSLVDVPFTINTTIPF